MITHAELNSALGKALDHLKTELKNLQIGRASTNLVEDIMAESYGSQMPLKAMANITCPDTKTIRIEPWDKTALPAIEKSIVEAKIGITPQNMGDSILLPIPPLTEERRKTVVKRVHELEEHTHITVRNLRQDAMKMVKHQKDEKEISEDEAKKAEKNIQDSIDKMNKDVSEVAKVKEVEVMKV